MGGPYCSTAQRGSAPPGGEAAAGAKRAKQSTESQRRGKQSRSHHGWQEKAQVEKYNRFIRLNLERESLPLHFTEHSQGESRSAGVAPRRLAGKPVADHS